MIGEHISQAYIPYSLGLMTGGRLKLADKVDTKDGRP